MTCMCGQIQALKSVCLLASVWIGIIFKVIIYQDFYSTFRVQFPRNDDQAHESAPSNRGTSIRLSWKNCKWVALMIWVASLSLSKNKELPTAWQTEYSSSIRTWLPLVDFVIIILLIIIIYSFSFSFLCSHSPPWIFFL